MPRSKPNYDFDIHVDPSCISDPMDEETQPQTTETHQSEEVPDVKVDNSTVEPEAAEEAVNTETEENPGKEDTPTSEESHIEEELQHDELEDAPQPTADEPAELEHEASVIDTEIDPSTVETSTEVAEETLDIQPSIEEDEPSDTTADDSVSRRSSATSSRGASKRTEDMIQAAAREIVAQIEVTKNNQDQEDNEGTGDISILSERTDESHEHEQTDNSFIEPSVLGDADADSQISHETPRAEDMGDNSSQQGATDEDVFSDKSPRSSLGSYDGGSESGKVIDSDNMTTITRSPRISNISQYDRDDDLLPTARGTPRPPFRTPSDVRALQLSSPTPSVTGSPRPAKRQFPTVSRLGTPHSVAQYSPKRKSTPPRFKSRQEAPLVLLHATLLPLRWVWGDVINSFETSEMSEQLKTLQNSWRMLQDRVGDTVIERGILLGHPQDDYEVLEERLLEALELPFRHRARILECGHYLGPANESTITDSEDSEDEFEKEKQRSANKRHWCGTCQNEIRYDALGSDKIFRVKVYASNGLMKSGAWAACWREMERIDAELEPIVDSSLQDEIVRLAAAQQDRELSHQEEAEIAREVAQQFEEERQNEQHGLLHASVEIPPAHHELEPEPELEPELEPEPEIVSRPIPIPEPVREQSRVSSSTSRSHRPSRRHRDEQRLHEIYGGTPQLPESRSSSLHHHHQHQRHPDSFIPPPSPRSPSEQAYERREGKRRGYQSASLPELLMEALRVLVQDSKNIAIIALSAFVLFLTLRNAPPKEPAFESSMGRAVRDVPQMQMQQTPIVAEQQQQYLPAVEPVVAQPSYHYQRQQQVVEARSVPTTYEPCETPVARQESVVAPVISEVPQLEQVETETETETQIEVRTQTQVQKAKVTQKKVVRVVQTVTETVMPTITETEMDVETETMVETVQVVATGSAQAPEPVTPAVEEVPEAVGAVEEPVLTSDKVVVPQVEDRVPVLEMDAEPLPEHAEAHVEIDAEAAAV
ncbi:hypothetical protein F5Y15DRAFT_62548 [Xylariaceae sp. FL0016]|nr:hypothetical protein F5Y15DRAFT_62548 [Xylariaceae sp. FL0016]